MERWEHVTIGEYLDDRGTPGNEVDWADWSQGVVASCGLFIQAEAKRAWEARDNANANANR